MHLPVRYACNFTWACVVPPRWVYAGWCQRVASIAIAICKQNTPMEHNTRQSSRCTTTQGRFNSKGFTCTRALRSHPHRSVRRGTDADQRTGHVGSPCGPMKSTVCKEGDDFSTWHVPWCRTQAPTIVSYMER